MINQLTAYNVQQTCQSGRLQLSRDCVNMQRVLTKIMIQDFVWSAVGTGQTTLFGNNQNKLGSTLGTIGTFGATGFNSGAGTLGFGAPQQPVGEQLETDCLIQSERLKGFHSYTCIILICRSLLWFLCVFFTWLSALRAMRKTFVKVSLSLFSKTFFLCSIRNNLHFHVTEDLIIPLTFFSYSHWAHLTPVQLFSLSYVTTIPSPFCWTSWWEFKLRPIKQARIENLPWSSVKSNDISLISPVTISECATIDLSHDRWSSF